MGLTRNAVAHHVRVLVRVQLVKVVAEGSLRVLYPVGAAPSPLPAWLRRNADCLALVEAVRAAGVLAREDVSRVLPDVPERTRNHYLQRLVASGVLSQEVTPEGRKVLLRAKSSGGTE